MVNPEQNRRKSAREIIGEKVREMVDTVKQRFSSSRKTKESEDYLRKTAAQDTDAPEKKRDIRTEQKRILTELKTIIASEHPPLVADVQHMADELAQTLSAQAVSEKEQEYARLLSKGAHALTADSALPYARYIVQAQESGITQLQGDDDYKKHLSLLHETFIQETDHRSDDLNAALIVATELGKRYRQSGGTNNEVEHKVDDIMGQLRQRGVARVDEAQREVAATQQAPQQEANANVRDIVDRLRLDRRTKEYIEDRLSDPVERQQIENMLQDARFTDEQKRAAIITLSQQERQRSASTEELVDKYHALEKIIGTAAFSQDSQKNETSRRRALYDLLEVDLDHQIEVLQEIKKHEKEISNDELLRQWEQHFRSGKTVDGKTVDVEGYKGYDELLQKYPDFPPEVRQAAIEYRDAFAQFMQKRIKRLTNWTQTLGESDTAPRSPYYLPEYYDLSLAFSKGVVDAGYVGLAFIDNRSNIDVKDIYVRSKMKSMLRHEFEHQHLSDHEIDHELGEDKMFVSIHHFADAVLSDLNTPYVVKARYALEGQSPNPELGVVIQKIDQLINARAFSSGDLTFLGGLAPENKGTRRLFILSSDIREIPAHPILFGNSFVEARKMHVSQGHKSLKDIMNGFGSGARHLEHVAKTAKQFEEGFVNGDEKAIAGMGQQFSNELFDTLASEAPVIAAAAKAYVDTFKRSILYAGNQQRPSESAISMEAGTSPQEESMKRVLRAAFPNKSDDELKVYMTIGKMYAVAQGDLIHILARSAPPVDLIPKDPKAFYERILPELSRLEFGLREQGKSQKDILQAKADRLFELLNVQDTQLKITTYDAFMRVLLMKVNPFYYNILWADTNKEFRLQDLFFSGAYSIEESDFTRGNKVADKLLGSRDHMSTPWEILRYSDDEKRAVVDGLTQQLKERRFRGEVPIAYRLVGLSGYTGVSERGGWRWDVEQLRLFIGSYLDERRSSTVQKNGDSVTVNAPDWANKLTRKDMYALVHRSMYLGPNAARNLMALLFENPEFSSFRSSDMGKHDEYKKYIDELVYEYFPSAFTYHADINQWMVKGENKRFDQVWLERLTRKLAGGESLKALLPDERHASPLYGITQRGSGDIDTLRHTSLDAKQIMQLLMEAQNGFETLVLNLRNSTPDSSWRHGPPISLRTILSTLSDESLYAHYDGKRFDAQAFLEQKMASDSQWAQKNPLLYENMETILDSASKLVSAMSDQMALRSSRKDVMKVIANELYEALYSSKSTGIGPENSGEKNANRKGITDSLWYYNFGASSEDKRRTKVGLFEFLRGLESKKYIYNVFHAELENFGKFTSVQHTGDGNSGRSLVQRKYLDLGTYMEGVGQIMEAFNVIPEGMRALSRQDYKAAEKKFLGSVLTAAKTFEKYNSEAKRHEMVAHMLTEWVLATRAPRGRDIWGIDQLLTLFKGNKSFGELVGESNRINKSEMRLNYIGLQNFLYEAQKMGLLPMHSDGKVPVAVATFKERNVLGLSSMFNKMEAKVAEYESRLRTVPTPEEIASINNQIKDVNTRIAAEAPNSERHATLMLEKKALEDSLKGRQLDEKEKLKFRERVFHKIFKFGLGIGDMPLPGIRYIRDDKTGYKWNVNRLAFMYGESSGKNWLQYLVMAGAVMFVIAAVAAANGLREFDTK